MIKRDIVRELGLVMNEFPVVALLGPRQVGKTTIARSMIKRSSKPVVFLDLERSSDLRKLDDAELFFMQHRDHFVIIDEVQKKPELFTYLRPEVDELRKNGRFLLTGSASPHLIKGVSESLAGRISYLEMHPISLTEALKHKIGMDKHWLRGGFPAALKARSIAASDRWKENFIRSYVERDLSDIYGLNLSPYVIRNFWQMLAGTQGAIWNSENYARSLGVTHPTVNKYLDLLEGAYLIRKLPAWFVSAHKRVVKAPKIYLRDSGLLHYFNQVHKVSDLPGNIIVGASWEGYVIEEICRKLPAGIRASYYRTHHGAEVDLVLIKGLKPVAAIEIKYSLSPKVSRGFYEAMEDLSKPASFIIVPSGASYRTKDGCKVVSLTEFLSKDLSKI